MKVQLKNKSKIAVAIIRIKKKFLSENTFLHRDAIIRTDDTIPIGHTARPAGHLAVGTHEAKVELLVRFAIDRSRSLRTSDFDDWHSWQCQWVRAIAVQES